MRKLNSSSCLEFCSQTLCPGEGFPSGSHFVDRGRERLANSGGPRYVRGNTRREDGSKSGWLNRQDGKSRKGKWCHSFCQLWGDGTENALLLRESAAPPIPTLQGGSRGLRWGEASNIAGPRMGAEVFLQQNPNGYVFPCKVMHLGRKPRCQQMWCHHRQGKP